MKARLPQGFGGGAQNMNSMIKQAQKMQEEMEKAQEEIKAKEYSTTVGGGVVEITMTGDKVLKSITLKPEGTAGAVRAFLEGKLFADALPCKMYYLNNPVFRYEKPQAGRLREHHQFGMECFGGKEPTVEAE